MYDVVIVGAGAAGLMAAGTAAADGRRVLLVEKMEKAGRKIRITGKGRCNLTNARSRQEFMEHVRANPEFFQYGFNEFDNRATVSFFRKEGLKLTIERGERVFPTSEKAWDVAETLVDWVKEQGAQIMYNTTVTDIRTVGNRICGVSISTKRGFPRNIECRNVVICTGGVTYPATGSTGDGYHFADKLGHRIEPVRPSLVPLVSESKLALSLAGMHLKNVRLKLYIDGEQAAEEFGEMDFTKRGIEGAIILRISRTAVDALIEKRDVKISLDIKPALEREILTGRIARETEALGERGTLKELLRKLMPAPMILPFAEYAGIKPGTFVTSLTEDQIEELIRNLKDIIVPIADYRPMEEAVVTAGGVSVEEIDPETLQSRLVRGLYFAGEVLDIDADTGGYNLQVAFSTGHLAGKLKGSAYEAPGK